jgi:hypothetical protein
MSGVLSDGGLVLLVVAPPAVRRRDQLTPRSGGGLEAHPPAIAFSTKGFQMHGISFRPSVHFITDALIRTASEFSSETLLECLPKIWNELERAAVVYVLTQRGVIVPN